MDENLGANDPYRQMESGEEGIQPDFLKGKGEGAKGALAAAENLASMAIAAKTGKAPTGGAKAAEAGAKAGGKKSLEEGSKSGASKAEAGEKKASGLYNNGRSQKTTEEGEPKLSMPKGLKAAAPVLILFLALGGILFLIIGLPVLMIGAIDYNLQNVLGFTDTVGILEKQGEYVTAELAENGEFPSEYASSLASNGIEIGQVTANGDFYRTNTYIANIEEKDGLVAAAGGFSYISDAEGQLAMLYDGKIIHADEFVAAVESDPKLYMAYSNAANISTKYYYGEDVEKVYKDMGLSRGNFNDWEYTGDYEADEKTYQEILTKTLDSKASLEVGGRHKDADKPSLLDGVEDYILPSDSGTWTEPVTNAAADYAVDTTTEKTKEYIEWWEIVEYQQCDDVTNTCTNKKKLQPHYSNNATDRAAELLNTAVSSGEPYLASNAFIAIEEAIQRARVDGDGPVNHVMNTLSQGMDVTYQDVKTGSMVNNKLSILETENFRAVVSDNSYSLEEANNFGRDRVLQTTGMDKEDIIENTVVGAAGKAASSAVVRNGIGTKANIDTTSKAKESIKQTTETANSDLFQSVVGANRIVEGGSYLSNTINLRVVGAMPSSASVITAYNKEVEEVIARKAEAERATLSPFDISSPNTFLGSIVSNFASAAIKNYGGNRSVLSAMSGASDAVSKAANNLLGTAVAEGSSQKFTTISGTNCKTVNAVQVEGDLYCTSHNTISTKYMKNKMSDWKTELGDAIDDDGKATPDKGLQKFMENGMTRYASVGVKSAEVCKVYREHNPGGVFQKIKDLFSDAVGLYDVCDEGAVPKEIATGAAYTFGPESNPEYKAEVYAGYVLYDEVKSLLTGTESAVSEFREKYDAAHPQDNSEAGVVARRSGMTKAEAEVALAYADYLNMIANYDASSRFAFGKPLFEFEEPMLIDYSDTLALNLYAWHLKETEYDDLRTRNFVV